jgi:phosphoglycerate dehydrogenase-like enzyme
MLPDHLADVLTPELRAIDSMVDVLPVSVDGHWQGDPSSVEVLLRFFPNDRFPGQAFGTDALRVVLRAAPRLRWIHNGATGVESLLIPELVGSEIVLTNGSGAHKRAIAETVLGFMLADAKALVQHLREQRAARWTHLPHHVLSGRTVAIIGLGEIGLEIARLCAAFEMRVIGTKRTPVAPPPLGVTEVFAAGRQRECVSQADYVIVAAALTPATRGMIDRAMFAMMRPTAAFINVARGSLVDEEALLEALRHGRIRAAYLDVFATEPLPPESPFFALPNVVVTPHNAAWSPWAIEEAIGIFVDNFSRLCRGQPLRNVVDKSAGY